MATDPDFLICPPEQRTISVLTGRTERFFLPFPYIIFGFHAMCYDHRLVISFANEYPTDETIVYFPPIGNVYGNSWKVCLNEAVPIPKTLQEGVDYFWNSIFTGHLHDEILIGPTVLRDESSLGTMEVWRDTPLEEILETRWSKRTAIFANFKILNLHPVFRMTRMRT